MIGPAPADLTSLVPDSPAAEQGVPRRSLPMTLDTLRFSHCQLVFLMKPAGKDELPPD